MIRWKLTPTAHQFHSRLGSTIDSLVPIAIASLARAGENAALCELNSRWINGNGRGGYSAYMNVRIEELTPEAVERFITKHVNFRWKTRCRPNSRGANATASYRKMEVGFNPYALLSWHRLLSPEDFEARLTDLIMHEIGHLLSWHFTGGSGHGRVWRMWARVTGFVGIGCTNIEKKIRLSKNLHPQRLRIAAEKNGSNGSKAPTPGLPEVSTWDAPESKNAADLTRQGLLAGIGDDEIVRTIRQRYPEYGAWKIAVPVYRRELKKKGLL